jgi:hypothetical protein
VLIAAANQTVWEANVRALHTLVPVPIKAAGPVAAVTGSAPHPTTPTTRVERRHRLDRLPPSTQRALTDGPPYPGP